jgi:hypothetical protein
MREQSVGRWVVAAVTLALTVCVAVPVAALDPVTTPAAAANPEEVVRRYLEALKAGNFPVAYDQLTRGMVQNKDRDAWAKEQQWSMQMSDAKIFSFRIFPGKIEGDKARVPNVLSSQDKFLNQLGVSEYELYTLVREGGAWKINQQQIVEKADQGTWFPAPAPEK